MLSAVETWPFAIAALLLLLIAAVEIIAVVVGASLSEWLHHSVADLDTDALNGTQGSFDKLLGWLHVGKAPVLVLLVLALASFSLLGFGLNLAAQHLFSVWVTPFVSIPLAFVATLPLVHVLGASLCRIVPHDQTYAVSFDSLIGRVATIVNGTARPGYPAQARVSNEHGQALYVMVEPETAGVTFEIGDPVLLNRRIAGNRFKGTISPWLDSA